MEDVQEINFKKDEGIQIGMPIEGDKVLIEVSQVEQCLYILGHKIDGFKTLEEFLKYLNRFIELEEENKKLKDGWDKLREWLKENFEQYQGYDDSLNNEDVLKKMEEIDNGR